ncbi:MAG TPA: hypothetical protein VG142_19465, partial [Trebonia sp.]|nr:hypothetical protein [Trebonia sp.]
MGISRSSLVSLSPGRRLLSAGRAPLGILANGNPGRRDARAEAAESLAANGSTVVVRALRSLGGVFVIMWAFRLDGYLTFTPWLAVPVVLLGLTGLAAVVTAWLPRSVLSEARQHQIGWIILAAVIVGLALWTYFQLFTAPDYPTDEMAFDQYAAQLALHGINPYLHSMAPAFPLFHVSPNNYTFELSGQPVTALSYPALAFEAYLPLLAVGVTTQAAVWVNVTAWAASAVLLYAVLPRSAAPLAAVIASIDVYIGYAAGGVTDALYVPLLIGAAAGWDRFAAQRGIRALRSPVCMGLAMAVKQTPWLVLPFVLAGIAVESRQAGGTRQAVRDSLRYLAIALCAFLVPNMPYLATAPGAWLRGILTPMSAPSVPAGQGLISLSLSLPVGGGSLFAYSVATVVVLLALFGCYVANYPVLKPAAFVLPSVALFFADRSFGSYLVMLIPAAIAAMATTHRPAAGIIPWRHWKPLAACGGIASVAAVTVALTAASPLTLSIRSVRTTGQLATVEQVTLDVANNTGRSVQPAFTIQEGTTLTSFWHLEAGPAVLGPHENATYTIEAPNYFAMPSIQNGFQVLAFLGTPASVSRTSSYLASTWRVVLQPDAIDQPVPVGQRVTVQAEVVDRLDQPVRVADVPVYLGQVIYAQQGLQYSQAYINNGLAGQTPVEALTNNAGIATFSIRSPVSGEDPVYFEANLVNPSLYYPFGYSPILT